MLHNYPHKALWRGALMFSLICTLNKRLSKQSWGWWFEMPSRQLWRHCNVSERRVVVNPLISLIFAGLASHSDSALWPFRLCHYGIKTMNKYRFLIHSGLVVPSNHTCQNYKLYIYDPGLLLVTKKHMTDNNAWVSNSMDIKHHDYSSMP